MARCKNASEMIYYFWKQHSAICSDDQHIVNPKHLFSLTSYTLLLLDFEFYCSPFTIFYMEARAADRIDGLDGNDLT